ncbi:hypothetical protein E2C01_041038 [Portunus trituberculatus]|uniref:Uncharacterized protein n=1 Tax=Portunus trituberculatus TaxID=210409 RepID=A0A5B7FPB7_PORTR|nr:hypothetical protein [Portunus trituberculatus]
MRSECSYAYLLDGMLHRERRDFSKAQFSGEGGECGDWVGGRGAGAGRGGVVRQGGPVTVLLAGNYSQEGRFGTTGASWSDFRQPGIVIRGAGREWQDRQQAEPPPPPTLHRHQPLLTTISPTSTHSSPPSCPTTRHIAALHHYYPLHSTSPPPPLQTLVDSLPSACPVRCRRPFWRPAASPPTHLLAKSLLEPLVNSPPHPRSACSPPTHQPTLSRQPHDQRYAKLLKRR